jgi:hypothetical protein
MYQEPKLAEEAYGSRIDSGKEFEVTYWSRRFGVTKAQLRRVIEQVGNRPADVQQALAPADQRIAA